MKKRIYGILFLLTVTHTPLALCDDDVTVQVAQTKKCEITDYNDPYSMMFPDRDLNALCVDAPAKAEDQPQNEVYSSEEKEE